MENIFITRKFLIICATAYGQEYGNDSYGYNALSCIIDSMFEYSTLSFELEEFKKQFGTWTLDFVYAANDLI